MSLVNYFDNVRSDASFSGNKDKEAECLKCYDKNEDGVLDRDEFHTMCLDLLHNDDSDAPISQSESREIFDKLDENQDGHIDKDEFHILWKYWLPMILRPRSALIVVDVQNDFIDGSLAVNEAEAVVPVINGILDTVEFERVVYTFDWHPEDHVSFHKNISLRELHPTSPLKMEEANVFDTVVFDGPVPCEQTLWPAHCVMHSHGAKLHRDLKVVENHTQIYKGSCNHVDSYSAFFDNNRLSQTDLTKELCSRHITDVYVCGLAYDVCVRHSAVDAVHLGFRTVVIEDGSKGLTEESTLKAKRDLLAEGCLVVPSSQVKSMVTACKRHPQMALTAARNVAEARRKAKDKLASNSPSIETKPTTLVNGSENTAFLLDL